MVDKRKENLNHFTNNQDDNFQRYHYNTNLNYHQGKLSIQPRSKSTQPLKNLQMQQSLQRSRHVKGEFVKGCARDCYFKKRRGLTCLDLIKGPYKCADTVKQAQDLLQNCKKRKIVFTNSSMKMPQQYFGTEDDAEQAYIDKKKSTQPNPSGVLTAANTCFSHHSWRRKVHAGLDEGSLAQLAYELGREEKEATNFAQILWLAAHRSNRTPPSLYWWAMHNLRIDFMMPPEAYHNEAFSRIAPIRSKSNKNKDRHVSAVVGGYIIPIQMSPNGRTTIRIGTSDQPFPISLSSPDRVTSSLTALGGQIRRVICSYFSDLHDRIVPPVHQWRLLQMDLNTDIRVSAPVHLDTINVQMELADDVIMAVYKKTLLGDMDTDHHRYVRVEKREHQFRGTGGGGQGGTPLDHLVGSAVVSVAAKFRQDVAKAAAEALRWG